MLKNITPAYYLLIIPMLRLSAPFFLYRLKYYMVIPFMMLWFIWSISVGNKVRNKRHVMAVIAFVTFIVVYALYQFLPFLYTLMGYGNAKTSELYVKCVSLLYLVFWGYVINWSLKNQKIRELKFLLCIAALGLIFTGMKGISAYDIFEDVGGARALTGIGAAGDSMEQLGIVGDMFKFGQGNYTYIYAISFLVSILVYWFIVVKSWVVRCLAVLSMGAIFIAIRNGGLTTPVFVIAVSLMSLVAYYMFGKSRKVIVFVTSIMAIVLLAYAYNPRMFSFVSPVVRWAGELIDSKQFSYRLISIADSLDANGSFYAYERYQLQRRSFDTFCDSGNYLFGNGAYSFHQKSIGYGGHSTICDTLAMYGVWGFLLWISFYVLFIKWFNRMADAYFDPKARVLPMLFVGACVFASMANPVRDIHELCILVVFGVAAFMPNRFGLHRIDMSE